jgi:hypothetical protein
MRITTLVLGATASSEYSKDAILGAAGGAEGWAVGRMEGSDNGELVGVRSGGADTAALGAVDGWKLGVVEGPAEGTCVGALLDGVALGP